MESNTDYTFTCTSSTILHKLCVEAYYQEFCLSSCAPGIIHASCILIDLRVCYCA